MTVQKLSAYHRRDCRMLFEDVSFSVNEGDKLAIIGEEGNGKSTLIKLIYDPHLVEDYADWSGTISHKKETMGYLPQEEADGTLTIDDLFADLSGQEAAYARKEARRLGIEQESLSGARCISTLSGGERVKLRLCILTAVQPDILLLDEPSNDLDLDTLLFLEDFLIHYKKTVIFISHDPDLLSKTATAILHLELTHRKTRPRVTYERKDYSSYISSRGIAIDNQTRIAKNEHARFKEKKERWESIYRQVEIAQASISRQFPSTGRLLKKKMHTVKAMEHRLEREEENLTKIPDVEEAIFTRFAAASALPTGKLVVNIDLDVLSLPQRVLAKNVRLQLVGNQKIALVGANGVGKTTLLKYIHTVMSERSDLKVAYLPQDLSSLPGQSLDPVSFLSQTGKKEEITRLRTYLGSLKYTAEEMMHPFSSLSGGQKAKLVFLKLCQSQVNVLLLDEPTRNLSPLSAPVIRELITSFPGAVIAVTHDRSLIRSMNGRILRLTPQGIEEVSLESFL